MAEPVSPVLPGNQQDEVSVAEGQAQYMTLPAIRVLPTEEARLKPLIGQWLGRDGVLLTRWQFTPEELARISETGYVYVWLWTFGQRIQPVALTVVDPQRVEPDPMEELPIGVSEVEA